MLQCTNVVHRGPGDPSSGASRFDRGANHSFIQSVRNHRHANLLQKDQTQTAVADLLVVAHQLEVAHRAQRGSMSRQTGLPIQGLDALHRLRRKPAEPSRQFRSNKRAGGYRFAVQPLTVAEARLDRVSKGVPEVEQGALPGFALVRGNDLSLVGAGTMDGVGESLRVPRQQPVEVRFQPGKELRITNQAGWLIAVFPPTDESTWESSVVGIWMKGMPRW